MSVVECRSLLRILGVSFLLFISCDCLRFQLASARLDQVSVEKVLPRKLLFLTGKVTFKVQGSASEHSTSKNYFPEKKNLSDKLEQKKDSAAARPRPGQGLTWQQWMEDGGDSSDFFTMDYSRVRRRRPIHNKALPAGP